jgi:hypothetical protein
MKINSGFLSTVILQYILVPELVPKLIRKSLAQIARGSLLGDPGALYLLYGVQYLQCGAHTERDMTA